MAITPQEFFSKNLKWITLILFFLFALKSMQSCNRKTLLNMGTSQYIQQIDSIQNEYDKYYTESQDSIKKLNFQIELANERVLSAQQQVESIERAVERIRSNTTTTVVVKGLEEVKDTLENINKDISKK
jgi:predicted PurR-regulated permease PerM